MGKYSGKTALTLDARRIVRRSFRRNEMETRIKPACWACVPEICAQPVATPASAFPRPDNSENTDIVTTTSGTSR